TRDGTESPTRERPQSSPTLLFLPSRSATCLAAIQSTKTGRFSSVLDSLRRRLSCFAPSRLKSARTFSDSSRMPAHLSPRSSAFIVGPIACLSIGPSPFCSLGLVPQRAANLAQHATAGLGRAQPPPINAIELYFLDNSASARLMNTVSMYSRGSFVWAIFAEPETSPAMLRTPVSVRTGVSDFRTIRY